MLRVCFGGGCVFAFGPLITSSLLGMLGSSDVVVHGNGNGKWSDDVALIFSFMLRAFGLSFCDLTIGGLVHLSMFFTSRCEQFAVFMRKDLPLAIL